jgi:hypothetical protein
MDRFIQFVRMDFSFVQIKTVHRSLRLRDSENLKCIELNRFQPEHRAVTEHLKQSANRNQFHR